MITKHLPGKHDQKTHGRKGGKGGSGGGGSTNSQSQQYSESSDKARQVISERLESAVSETEDEIDSLSSKALGYQDMKAYRSFERLKNQTAKARQDFKDAAKLKGKKQQAKMQSGLDKLDGVMGNISNSDYDADDVAQGLYESLTEIFQDPDKTFENLGLDVDNIFGP